MRISRLLSLALVGSALAVVPAMQSLATAADSPTSIPDKHSIVQKMRASADGRITISTDDATGKVGFVRALDGDLLPTQAAPSRAAAISKSISYLNKYGAAFGIGAGQLHRAKVTKDRYGWTIAFNQKYQGLPVFGARMLTNVDKSGRLLAVNGFAAPDLRVDTKATFTAKEAARRAVLSVRQDPPVSHEGEKTDVRGLKVSQNKLVIYRTGALRGVKGTNELAYAVTVRNEAGVNDAVFVDAHSGKLLNRYSTYGDALERHLYEADGSSDPSEFVNVWNEGDAFPGALDEDQQNEVVGTGEAYWFFQDTFGRDSYDGAGAPMYTVNNDGRINCPNANWNGETTNYCSGVSSDDVVAHEWGHAHTEFTSGLIYQWQPGALNESYSDVWGETVDLINARMDEGETNDVRPDGACSTQTTALPMVIINTPESIAKVCDTGAAQFGPEVTVAGVTGNVVVGTDVAEPADPAAGLAAGTTFDGCSALNNAAEIAGNVVMLNRGRCSFKTKALHGQEAGATAVIVANNVDGVQGLGEDATITTPITVPTVLIASSDRDLILGELETADVNVTIKAASASETDSYRWLIGEKSPAFGTAIRDMWTPTCVGDPGKVSDAEYYCSEDDSGGVHSNSGVPNHAFALLVDGGTFNGITVPSIGLDKAANLWFHTMTHYLTPSSGFPEMADGLDASCAALVGQPINKMRLDPDGASESAAPFAAADCAAVAAATSAVEMRKDVVQCNFQPLMEAGNPSACGSGFVTGTVWSEDFEAGLGQWTSDQEVVYDGGHGYPWEARATAPGEHASAIAFAPDPIEGACGAPVGDISSRDGLISPIIQLPRAASRAPQMSWEQYVATESGYDGGNVKISVNGGAFTQIPSSAYTFNGPNTTLETDATNTSPLAGQDGWAGTDGGVLTGTWGKVVLDLTKVGVGRGDSLQFRFDMGRDGCNGIEGWAIDNVSIVVCKLKTKVTAVRSTDPTTFGDPSSVTVTVARDGSVGEAPDGNVTLTNASGAEIGTGALADGKTKIALPADFPVGTTALKVSYAGTADYDPSSTSLSVTVKPGATPPPPPPPPATEKLATKTTAKASTKTPAFKQDFKVTVKVTSTSPATGEVKVKIDGKVYKVVKLANGKAVIKVKQNLKPGLHKVLVKYLGDGGHLRSKAVVKVTVKK